MTLSTTTLSPNSTVQNGLWTVVGAASAHAALSSGVNTDYIQTTSRARNNDVCRVGFPALTLPAGAKIFSVAVRVTSQTVTYPAPLPQAVHHIRCRKVRPEYLVVTIILLIIKFLLGFRCPRTPTDPATGQPTTTQWLEQTVGTFLTNDGVPWTVDNFNPFEYDFGRDDTSGNALRHSELRIDVTYAEQSAVTVTGPTGSITDTCRPTVTWTYASPQSDPQQAYRVAIYTPAQVALAGFEAFTTTPTQSSGWLLGDATAWTLNSDITNGTWYAYVQAQQRWDGTGTYESAAASGSWTQAIVGAAVPVLQSVAYDRTYNRTQASFVPGGVSPATVAFRLETSRDGGPWGPVRGGVLVAASGMGTVSLYDYEAPLNVESRYRVLAYSQTGGLYFASATYSSELGATPVQNVAWLKDPLNPALSTVFPIATVGDSVTRQKIQGVFPVLTGGPSAYKVVVTGPQYGVEGTYTLVFHQNQPADYWAAFQLLDATGHTLLVQYPTGEQHYIVFGPGSVGQDQQSSWDINLSTNKRRYTFVTVSYTEVKPLEITS